ncbi:hypothetical protein TRFO_16866 [Tritrichomonas foetus]|uniref:Uncharacterized protein n=1 Tax=Tritrichomonas foetus TaxID=1144522 RepID=A0A1J4KQC5_9EUKA|nr:hypothetical protein TRFO_16866 [Tritrichomonas foetus]|eukprot:OHT13112.1 hypothetical protein TRFO_16866 [Tritrichomonas foetus]
MNIIKYDEQMIPHSDVRLSLIIHSILVKAEKEFKKMLAAPKYHQKRQFSTTIMLTKVLLARFLILYRWVKLNPITSPKKRNLHEFDFSKIISEVMPQNRLSLYSKSIRIQPISLPKSQKVFNAYYYFHKLCPHQKIGHITKTILSRNSIIIISLPYYILILKVRKRLLKISKLRFVWDRKTPSPLNEITYAIKLIEPIIADRPNELERIDTILSSFYLTYFFTHIYKEISKVINTFKCQISVEPNHSFLIRFPNTYYPFNEFVMEIHHNRIEVHSKTPLYICPGDTSEVYERLKKLESQKFVMAQIYNNFIDPKEKFNASALLSELRDMVFYTSVRKFWEFLRGTLRSIIFSNNQLVLKCETKSILGVKVYFYNAELLLLTIQFDKSTGLPIFIPISDYYHLASKRSYPDIRLIMVSIFQHYFEYIEMTTLFKNHFMTLNRPFSLREMNCIRFNFSFSDSYHLDKTCSINYPSFSLVSKDDPVNLNPRTMILKLMCNKKAETLDDTVNYITQTSKVYVILAELEFKLKEEGIYSYRDVNVLWMPSMNCKFKITYFEFWSLTIEKIYYPFNSKGRIIILGNKISLRFADSIIRLIKNIYTVESLMFQSKKITIYSHDFENYIKPYKYHYFMSLRPFSEDYEINERHYYKPCFFKLPDVESRLMKFYPISNYAMKAGVYDEFAGYVKCSLIFHIKVCEIFHPPKWKVVPIHSKSAFTVLFENYLTMTFTKLLDDAHFIISVSSFGNSCLLLAPLSRIFQLPTTKRALISIKASINEIDSIQNEIETYAELFHHYQTMKIEHLHYHEGKVFGKGTRFYLVHTALDDQGIVVSSASFPSLVKMTTTIRNLNIPFRSKVKIYSYICSLMLADETTIIKLLNHVKSLTAQNRAEKLDWEEMAKDMYNDMQNHKLQFSVVENGVKCWIRFQDPVNHTILVELNDKKKSLPAKDFDDILIHANPDKPLYEQLFE